MPYKNNYAPKEKLNGYGLSVAHYQVSWGNSKKVLHEGTGLSMASLLVDNYTTDQLKKMTVRVLGSSHRIQAFHFVYHIYGDAVVMQSMKSLNNALTQMLEMI